MPGQPKRVGPTLLTTVTTTNLYNNSSAALYDRITHIHIANITANSAKASLWLGLTGANTAGTELLKAHPIDGGKELDLFFDGLLVNSTDFIVGGADTTNALVITITREAYVV